MLEWLRRTPTDQEAGVVAAILDATGDPRATRLLEQFRSSRRLRRRIDGPRLRVEVPWTTRELMVDLDVGLASAPVAVRDAGSGQVLTFRVHLARGGYLTHLEGRAETTWPRRWEVDHDELVAAARGALRLPTATSADALARWLGVEGTDVRARPPATPAAVTRTERREGRRLPADLADLLHVSDGADVAGWTVLGTSDLHTVALDGHTWWLVAVGGAPGDDRRCLADDTRLVVLEDHETPASEAKVAAGGIRDWLVALVRGDR